MRLIDADALKEKLLKERDAIPLTSTERYGFGVEFPNHHGQSMRGGIKKALRCMEETPTIDAVPVKRGTWKLNEDGSGTCDQCHFTQKAVWDYDNWQNYCGVCGADMRERKDGDA
jgi:hypothetical protein